MEPALGKRFFLVQTNEFDRLVDCVSYAMYGVTRTFFEKGGRAHPSLQQIEVEPGIWIIMPETEYKANSSGKSKKDKIDAIEKKFGKDSSEQGKDSQGSGSFSSD